MINKIMTIIFVLLITPVSIAQTTTYYCPSSVTCSSSDSNSCTLTLYSSNYAWTVYIDPPNVEGGIPYTFENAWRNATTIPGGIECQYVSPSYGVTIDVIPASGS